MADAAEIPKALFDYTVKQQIRTGRYASKVVRDIIGLLNKADSEILAKIAKTEAPFSKARLQALLKEIRTSIKEIYDEAGQDIKQQMLDFAGVQADATAAMLATRLPVTYNIVQATAEQLKAIVDVAPVTVGPDKKLLLEEVFSSLAAGKEESIRGAIRLGMVEGETIDQMVRRLRGTKAAQYKDGVLEVSRRHAEAMVRTVTNHTSNQAMQATFKNNAEVVKGWVFTSTLDGATSLTCRSLAGTVWPIGEGPIPPRHVRCRSVAVAQIKSWRELGFDVDELPPGMRSSKDGLVRSDISMDEWMRTQSKAEIVDMLGKTRADLFTSGKLKISSFADDKGIVYTLDQLQSNITKASPLFAVSKTVAEAELNAVKMGVPMADFKGMSLSKANAIEKAISVVPKEALPDYIGGSRSYKEIFGRPLGRKEKEFYGVHNSEHMLSYPAELVKRGNYETLTTVTGRMVVKDYTHNVWLSNGYKELSEITARKTAINAHYRTKRGVDAFFNETGETVPLHEFGHVFYDKKYLGNSWEQIGKRWYAETKTLSLSTPGEAFAEAFAEYFHNDGDRLPDYVKEFIEGVLK